jgi:hypothetical protein
MELYVLLTVHLDAVLGNDQLDALFLNVFFYASTCRAGLDRHDRHSPECVIPDNVLIQFGPPDDEHLLLEACTGIKINTLRNSASSWSLPRIIQWIIHNVNVDIMKSFQPRTHFTPQRKNLTRKEILHLAQDYGVFLHTNIG